MFGRRWLLFTRLGRKYPPTPANAVSPVMLVASHHLSHSDKERITRMFFEEFGVPAFAIYDAGLLALYAAGVLTGLTVDVGYEKTGNANDQISTYNNRHYPGNRRSNRGLRSNFGSFGWQTCHSAPPKPPHHVPASLRNNLATPPTPRNNLCVGRRNKTLAHHRNNKHPLDRPKTIPLWRPHVLW